MSNDNVPEVSALGLNTRRTFMVGTTAAAAAATLAACSSGTDTAATSSAAAPTSEAAAATTTGGEQAGAGAAPSGLTTTADIPVNGGKIFKAEKVVITQPAAGTYKGVSSTCTHEACDVSEVTDGIIHCTCHGSEFDLEGKVVKGPATSPLPEVAITVTGDSISLS